MPRAAPLKERSRWNKNAVESFQLYNLIKKLKCSNKSRSNSCGDVLFKQILRLDRKDEKRMSRDIISTKRFLLAKFETNVLFNAIDLEDAVFCYTSSILVRSLATIVAREE